MLAVLVGIPHRGGAKLNQRSSLFCHKKENIQAKKNNGGQNNYAIIGIHNSVYNVKQKIHKTKYSFEKR